jgi:hypothetical protein
VQIVGKYGEILRALGTVADAERVSQFEVTESDMFITISWRTDEEMTRRRSYGEAGIADLLRDARLDRSARGGAPVGFRESLRVVGQDLDTEALFLSSVTARGRWSQGKSTTAAQERLPGEITATTVTQDQQLRVHTYSSDELSEKSRQRRARRHFDALTRSWWRRLFGAKTPVRS